MAMGRSAPRRFGLHALADPLQATKGHRRLGSRIQRVAISSGPRACRSQKRRGDARAEDSIGPLGTGMQAGAEFKRLDVPVNSSRLPVRFQDRRRAAP